MRYRSLLNSLVVIGVFSALIFSKSCANTSTPPEGGPKDTIPPVLVEVLPVYNATLHPRDIRHSSVSFEFDEYVVLNNPNSYIFLSPPQTKPPTAKIKGKRVVVSFAEPLDSNQTYSLSLGEAIKDNNEGNPFPPYTHSFSTGDHVDSLFVSGNIVEASSMLPMANITVLFHTDQSDSALFKVRPRAAAKSDLWGYFTVRNLPVDTVYRVYAIEDLNNNSLYDPDQERVAFLDTLVIPSSVMRDSLPELAMLNMTDTLNCLSRPAQITLSLFKEVSQRQFLRNKARVSRRQMYLKFAAPYPQIDSLIIDGIPDDKLILEYNYYRDSVVIWINDQGPVPDTLSMRLSYMRTDDSLNILVPRTDTIRMVRPKGKMVENRWGEMVEEADTLAAFEVDATPENIDQNGIIIKFESPMLETPFDSVTIMSKNTREQVAPALFKVEQDTADIKKFTLRLEEKLVQGYEYTLRIPDSLFLDIDGIYCDSLVKKFSLPQDEKLSSLTVEAQNVHEKYLIELVDENRTKVFRSYLIDTASMLQFPYLKAAKYSIRITEDKNGNGQVDTGSLLDHKQPEKVLMYKANDAVGNNAYIMDIPERTELIQTIDIGEMFK
ncbi:MAG TPA: Ig-like domain-containing protein [Candidatus Coprenecus stercoravium]|uniref:Ig-like domain-containing protein n=1 Tax=Candidatus Coprenecus stercoravium TaxID=2840735 RepID=A0A9D2GQZ5_9BACT|nr:Ig-like domain-containing protein [Candidatus Coprenecus stercoravium]